MKTPSHWFVLTLTALSLAACSRPPEATSEPSPPAPTPRKTEPAPTPPAPKPKPAALTEIDITRFYALREQGKTRVYDVRMPILYKLGHIGGAISLPLKSFDERFPAEKAAMQQAVDEGKVIVVYCIDTNCPDGHTAGGRIAAHGIPVTVFRGGWQEWQEVGME